MQNKQFAVFGLGRFGKNVALTLEEMGYEVLGVDKDETLVENLAESLTRVVSFDIRDARALRQAGIANFDAVVIASKNFEASLMATMLCKELNVPEIIVKAIDERHAEIVRRLGATKVIFSERDTARRVAMNLASPNVVEYVDIDANIKILTAVVPRRLVGKNLIEAHLRADYRINIIAISSGKETLVTPPPDHVFAADDKIFIVGTPADLARFEHETTE